MTHSTRDHELAAAQARAARATARAMTDGGDGPSILLFTQPLRLGTEGAPPPTRPATGTIMSELMKHGGLYTLNDGAMMAKRFAGMMMGAGTAKAPPGMADEMEASMAAAAMVPTHFFYHLVRNPYKLHSQIVSYIVHPARHLRSPADPTKPPSVGPVGAVYSQANTESSEIPAAITFIGQFIDHDLTLNALNLLSPQMDSAIRDQASPLIDLDSVYGPRLDDGADRARLVPMIDGRFCLRHDAEGFFDVCRMPDPPTNSQKALIGDKRNDENQLILQVHIAAMRLHNYFMDQPGATLATAKRQTILYWQAMVATYYLPFVARVDAIDEVKRRLFSDQERLTLCHRPGLTVCGGTTLGMPHEFAIGFRFGHSQLRSRYVLRPNEVPIRLFDPLATPAPNDLSGGKELVASHVIDWAHFVDKTQAKSNLIDRQVNEVVFSLPESTIPDDVKLVGNLPMRNLLRSDDLGLCAGEDLVACYKALYPGFVDFHDPAKIEDDKEYRGLFKLDPTQHDAHADGFRTPLWYYLLREAELDGKDGRLGKVGSLLVAEVILSGIYYARLSGPAVGKPPICASAQGVPGEPCSIFTDNDWKSLFSAWNAKDDPLKSFLDLVNLGNTPGITTPDCPALPVPPPPPA